MNDQCYECKIRKGCYYDEPVEDWTCEHFEDVSKQEVYEMAEVYDNRYKWLCEEHETLGLLCKCPVCGYKAESHTIKNLVSGHALAPFCPSCGAQMARIVTVEMLMKYLSTLPKDTKVTFNNNFVDADYDPKMNTVDFY